MTAKAALCPNPCETCAKEGLPLLLTRYALMPADAKAPKLSGNLNAPELAQVPLGDTAHYGLRLLRSGYVYVFDEKRKHWDEYFVTSDGVLAKRPPRIMAFKARQVPPASEFACARNGAAPLAGVITIRNPKHAGKIWIAFSSVEWTNAVFAEHETASHRQKHMTCITISDGKVAPQPRTAPLEEADRHVPEFRFRNDADRVSWNHQRAGKDSLDFEMVVKKMAKGFNWNPFEFNSYLARKEAFLEGVKNARPQGGAAIVALHDPVGLALEIAALMEMRETQYMAKDAAQRFAANTIASLESTIKEQAKLAMMDEAVRQQAAAMGEFGHMVNEDVATMNITRAQLQAAGNDEWARYTTKRDKAPRFQQKHSQIWLDLDKTELQTFDRVNIAPLAKAHVSWLRHRCMLGHMTCNFDTKDIESGAAHTATVAAMLRNTADKQPCYDQYVQWVKKGDTADPSNLVMRALAFNQDKLLEEVKKADTAPLDARAFPTDMVLDFFKDGLEKLPQGGHAAMADLLQSVGGALFKNMDEALKGGPAARALAAVAGVAGVQFSRIQVQGHRGKFVQHVMQSVMQLDPNIKVNANQLNKAIAAQMRLMEVEGLPMNKTDKRQWLVVLDRNAARTAAGSGKTGAALAQELAKSLSKVENLPRLKAEAFKAGITSTSFDASGTFVIGLVQSYNIFKLVDDYRNQMKHEGYEPLARLATAGFAVLGSFGEATGLALQKAQEAGRLRNAPGLSLSNIGERLATFFKRVGLGTGLVVAGMDLMKAGEEYKKGDLGLFAAYTTVGVLGGGLAFVFFVSGSIPFVGWIIVGVAVIALLATTLWIEKHKDNKVQEWLARCHFGAKPEYKTEAEHAEQLKMAFA